MKSLLALPSAAQLLPADWPAAVQCAAIAVLAGGAVMAGRYCWRRAGADRWQRQQSELRFRRLFDEATVVMIEEDFTGVVQRLAEWRASGIGDVRAHLAAHPELVTGLFQLVRPTAVNRRGLALMGAANLAEYREQLRRHTAQAAPRGFIEQVQALWEDREAITIETAFRTRDGQAHRGILQWTVPVEGGRRNFDQVLLVYTDLTVLRETEERYRLLYEGAVEGVFETLPSGVLHSANPALARILGFSSPAELLALSPEALERLYADPLRRREFFTVVQGRDFLANFESEIRRPDGSTGWIKENVHVVRDAAGEPQYFQGFVTDITARKHAEQALRESEDRWRCAVLGSAAGIWENNLLTGECFYSDRSKEMLGFAPHEISNRREDWTTRIHPEDVPIGRRAMEEHLAGRQPYYQAEHRFLCKDGTYKWILSHGRAAFDSAGRPVRVSGTHVDIHERKMAEHQLQASETRYRMLFEHAPIAILESDDRPLAAWMEGLRAQGVTDLVTHLRENRENCRGILGAMHIIGANAAALRLVGAEQLAQAQDRLSIIVTPDVLAFREETILALWQGRPTYDREITIKALDGTLRRLHAYRWIPKVGGRLQYGGAQLILVDLTAEHDAQQALSAERERLGVTLRAMAEGVLTVDHTGVVRFINESACLLTGRPAVEAIGLPLGEVCALRHGRTAGPVPSPDVAARTGRSVVELPADTVVVRADGSHRQVEGRCAPMHDREGRDIGAVLVLHDVTEHTRLETELQRATKLESIGLLAGGIAHDFNNILAIIMGNITLALLDEQVKASAGVRWLQEAERGAFRARDLTRQLLTFAKGGEPVRASVQLPELVKEAALFALHGAAARCEFDLGTGLWNAEVDKGQIGQVVQNLVINAVQAMPQGGVIRITLRNADLGPADHPPLVAGQYVKLTIADTGRGIRPEDLPRIFEPYFTTKETGVGLGLATVYSIVRKHQGHITVESALEVGTAFHLWLPAARAAPVQPSASLHPFATGLQGRVLFMDDEESIRLMASVLLARIGLEAVTVEDGAEAVRCFRAARDEGRPFGAVVLDLTVPGGMGGLEALREMQAIDPDVRAIVSSGYSSNPVLANYRDYGFRGVVPKPYRITDLANALREVLEMKTPA